MRQALLVLLAALCAACGTSTKAIHSSAPKKDEDGSRVEVTSGFGQEGRIENVGEYSSVPRNWTGPVPPGWTPQDPTIRVAEAEARRAEALARAEEARRDRAIWEARKADAAPRADGG